MLQTQNIDLLLDDIRDDKTMALFLGSGTDYNLVYPGEDNEYVENKNGKRIESEDIYTKETNNEKELNNRRLYFKYRDKILHPDKWTISWNTLLEELTDYALLTEDETKALSSGDVDSPMKAAILKHKLGNGYIPIIRDWLYSRCNHDTLIDSLPYFKRYKKEPTMENLKKVPFATLFVIAEFILRKKSVRAVFTQNYNNFLTEAINLLYDARKEYDEYRDIHPIDVYDGWKDEPYTDNCLLIYHVHGYIPSPSEMLPRKESNHIVLTHDEFNSLTGNVFSWENASQLHFFTHHTCILWGLSLNDLTSLRLLRHANLERSSERVYWLRGGADDGNTALNQLKADYFESQKIYVVNDSDGYSSLYNKMMNKILTTQSHQL